MADVRPVLVTGFGPFPSVAVNPTAAVAQAVDGAVVAGGVPVLGRVLPVSFARGPDLAVALAREHDAQLVVGLGVARRRSGVWVERRGVRVERSTVDVDGSDVCLLDGPDRVIATLDVDRFARILGAEVSDDAGRYVCNAWLYRVAQALPVPVGFVHVPAEGIEPTRLLDGIAALL